MILIKALPHRSSNYFETVCCAGVGRDGRWRRQYPVPFRILEEGQKFGRWTWIRYSYTKPINDSRWESQKVIPETITVGDKLSQSKRAYCLRSLIRQSFARAEEDRQSLVLIEPKQFKIKASEKTKTDLERERSKHADLARQSSMFDTPAVPLEPCPYEFRVRWRDLSGKDHDHICDDWETSTAFSRRLTTLHSASAAIESLRETYEDQYMKRGMVLGFSTHSRRHRQWLLVGIIRVDLPQSDDLFK